MEVSGQLHPLAALPPKERAPDNYWIGGWVGPETVLDAVVERNITSLMQTWKLSRKYHEPSVYIQHSTNLKTRHYMEKNGQLHVPAALLPEKKRLGTYWIGSWVGLDVVVDKKNPYTCRKLNSVRPSRSQVTL